MVTTTVSGVAAERLAPICVSMTRGMTILIEVQTRDVEFVVVLDFFWKPGSVAAKGTSCFAGGVGV